MIQVIFEVKVILKIMVLYFKKIGNTNRISSWKFKGMSDEIIKSPTTSDNSLAQALSYIAQLAQVILVTKQE